MAKKYQSSDEGKVVGGRTVVFQTDRPQSKALMDRSAKAALAKALAAMMASAAARGVPFCEDCARAQLEKERKRG
ncbi:MAG TPA: hypothetical protein VLW85_11230 [Myxococcales bacterium]|nr:hypothetical protein [Myxococcales bacterium]